MPFRTSRKGGGASKTIQSIRTSFGISSPSRRRSSMATQPEWARATGTTRWAPLASMTASASFQPSSPKSSMLCPESP